jgi:phenylacetate-CoA ligase
MYSLAIRSLMMPLLDSFTGFTLWREYKNMIQIEHSSLDELRKIQWLKLKGILEHAYAKVPFYRDKFRRVGIVPDDIRHPSDLLHLPPTTKDEIMENFPDGITSDGENRSTWQYVATAGTTRQVMAIHDAHKRNVNWAAGLRDAKLAGNYNLGERWMQIPPHMCTNICGMNDQGPVESILSKKLFSLLLSKDFGNLRKYLYQQMYSRREKFYRRLTLPSFSSEGTNISEEDLDNYLNQIRQYRPKVLIALPTYLYTFAKYIMIKHLQPPPVKVVKPIGGSTTAEMVHVIKEGFHCDFFDSYGCSEMGWIACECPQHDGMHLFMDLYYLEICRDNKPVESGEVGRILVTDLSNRAMPFIRYDIGDVGKWREGSHDCGRNAPRLEVMGRIQDTLSNSRGRLFSSDDICNFFYQYSAVDNFQLIQKDLLKFDLLLVPKNGLKMDSHSLIKDFQAFFEESCSLNVYIVKSIKPEEGGKFRFVKAKNYSSI